MPLSRPASETKTAIKSVARKSLRGAQGVEPFSSGWVSFRFLIEREAFKQHPAVAELFSEHGMLMLASAEPLQMVMYPCAGDKLMNLVANCPSELVGGIEGDKGDFNTAARKSKLLDIFATKFRGPLRELLHMAPAETLKCWSLLDMADLPTWSTGRLACIGDAAHPFLPFRGQGAAMAIEDAISIAALFAPGTSAAAVPSRLQLYLTARRGRAMFFQDLTRNATKEGMVQRNADGSVQSSMRNLEQKYLRHNEFVHSGALLQESLAAESVVA